MNVSNVIIFLHKKEKIAKKKKLCFDESISCFYNNLFFNIIRYDNIRFWEGNFIFMQGCNYSI